MVLGVLLLLQGDCAGRLDVAAMTAEDKYTWSVRCGARSHLQTCVLRRLGPSLRPSGGRAQRQGSITMGTSAPKVLLAPLW